MTNSPTTIIMCALLAASSTFADSINASIKTDQGTYLGTIIERMDGAVRFKTTRLPNPITLTENQILSIRFSLENWDPEQLAMQYEDKEYQVLYTELNKKLSPLLTYATIPSDLSDGFTYWMVSSYWTGDYERATALGKLLSQSEIQSQRDSARIYLVLAALQTGNTKPATDVLNGSDGDRLFPPATATRLYLDARLAQARQEYLTAIKLAARLIAQHADATDWISRTDLLCAELYFQMKMPESAESVLMDIMALYTDSEILKQAAAIAAQK